MLTGAPSTLPAAPARKQRIWPWAAGSVILTLAIIAGTLIGHRLAAQARLASQVAPAPALPPLAVEAVAHAHGQITHLTLDTGTHTLVAQMIACLPPPPTSPQTPQATACDSADVTPVSGVAFFDSVTGAMRSEYLSPSSMPAQAIALTDIAHGVTYLLNNGGVTTFSDATGKQTARVDSAPIASAQTAALDASHGLIYSFSASGAIAVVSAADGLLVASETLAPISAPGPEVGAPQVFLDTSAGRLYIFAGRGSGPQPLYALDAATLQPRGSWSVPSELGLGPLDPTTHWLYLSAVGQTISHLDLSSLPNEGPLLPVTPTPDPALTGATRIGFDHATGATLLMTDAGAEAFSANATQPYAALPLLRAPYVFEGDAQPWLLPMDASAGVAYLPADDNTILAVSLQASSGHAAPTALTAAIIARAGMAKLLPNTNQNPPFLTAHTFPVAVGVVARQYFIHYSDLGWKGPYAGTASLSQITAGAAAGDYTMTFAITWNQLFQRQHSWTVQVTPDGRTHLLADSGDAIP